MPQRVKAELSARQRLLAEIGKYLGEPGEGFPNAKRLQRTWNRWPAALRQSAEQVILLLSHFDADRRRDEICRWYVVNHPFWGPKQRAAFHEGFWGGAEPIAQHESNGQARPDAMPPMRPQRAPDHSLTEQVDTTEPEAPADIEPDVAESNAGPAQPIAAPTKKRQRARPETGNALVAIKALYPEGVPAPDVISNGDLEVTVNKWLKQEHRPEAKRDAVLRAALRRKG